MPDVIVEEQQQDQDDLDIELVEESAEIEQYIIVRIRLIR